MNIKAIVQVVYMSAFRPSFCLNGSFASFQNFYVHMSAFRPSFCLNGSFASLVTDTQTDTWDQSLHPCASVG